MKKFIVFSLALVLVFGVVGGDVYAQEGTPSAEPTSRFGLFLENWRDRLQVWATRDEEKKEALLERIESKYASRLERIDALPENANTERIREVLEERRSHFGDLLDERAERRQEMREKVEGRIEDAEVRRQGAQEKRGSRLQELRSRLRGRPDGDGGNDENGGEVNGVRTSWFGVFR